MRNHADLKKLIPLTRLRHLYWLLRDVENQAFHLAMAEEFVRRPEPLIKIVSQSRQHFLLYDNRDEPFHGRGSSGAVSEAFSRSPDAADRATTHLSRGHATFSTATPAFDYLDYEVNHLRTTGTSSMAENGQPLSTSVDVLLGDAVGLFPIVAEVKADTDRNPFFALIQALTYAVELSTRTQQLRLENTYPGRFTLNPDSPGIGVTLISVGTQRGSNASEFTRLAQELATKVVLGTDGWLRRIAFYSADLQDTGVAITSSFVADRA